jgi:signal transduction histidine kinase
MGLKLIKERVEMINGEFEVTSQVGEGTRVALSVPESVL